MMLADSCEAAARSLARPDPENIRAIVVKIVDAIITDGQLDECDLTLQEMTTIREAIISALTAIYHARIDYPGFNPPQVTGPLSALARRRNRQRGTRHHLQPAPPKFPSMRPAKSKTKRSAARLQNANVRSRCSWSATCTSVTLKRIAT